MAAPEVTTHAKTFGTTFKDTIDLAVCLLPGSVSLAAYNLTDEGYGWGVQNQDMVNTISEGFDPAFSEHAQLLLSERFMGNFLVPIGGFWNYTFMGASFTTNMSYELRTGIPLEFYNEQHRVTHFLQFHDANGDQALEAEQEDVFA